MVSENYFGNISSWIISDPEIWSTEHLLLTSGILGLIIISIIIGNAFVIAAIILERNLHCVANYLILSLAIADSMVAFVVMPFSAVKEVTRKWFLGRDVCDMWIAMDVLCCTASILSLVAISIDRYWAVTRVDYTRTRSTKRILGMVAIVWIVSFSISVPSVFIFRDENNPAISGICIISQNHVYTIVSTIGAFYFPMIVILIIYAKIFAVARQRILRKRFSQRNKNFEVERKRTVSYNSDVTLLRLSRDAFSECELDLVKSGKSADHNTISKYNHFSISNNKILFAEQHLTSTTKSEILKAKREKEKLKRKKERRVALTLSIITGTFLTCWLPFFIIAILAPFVRPNVHIPKLVESITLWLGYCNSLLNPIIYTVFNPDFRSAFRNLIYGKCLKACRKQSKKNELDSFWV